MVYFSAVSTPNLAIKGSFCSIFWNLQDFLKMRMNFLNFSDEKFKNFPKFHKNFSIFSKILQMNEKHQNFARVFCKFSENYELIVQISKNAEKWHLNH